MQIRVRCGCGEAGCPEWAIVEVQGVVQPQPCFSGRIQGLHIGRLCAAAAPSSKARTTSAAGGLPPPSRSRPSHVSIDSDVQAAFTFTVGYHELAGTKVALKKPLLVLRKKKTAAAAETELEVIGVIRHKILFKDRPKALISKPQVKEKKTLPLPAPAAAPLPQSS
uniref:Chromosome transmission fidelity protein 8 n=1 Tax=Oryza glumipatula TaxID=40148 RepID=A0A0E0B123_9ORYZ